MFSRKSLYLVESHTEVFTDEIRDLVICFHTVPQERSQWDVDETVGHVLIRVETKRQVGRDPSYLFLLLCMLENAQNKK